jgi:rubrerythrin
MHNDDIPLTKENLLSAISEENYETNIMYREFAKKAKEEGFDNIADLFNLIGDVEKHHSERFQSLLKSLEENSLYESKDPVL